MKRSRLSPATFTLVLAGVGGQAQAWWIPWIPPRQPRGSSEPQPVEVATAAVVPAVSADITGDGIVDSNDLFAFLTAYLAGSIEADFDRSGTIDSMDLHGMMNAFLAGPVSV